MRLTNYDNKNKASSGQKKGFPVSPGYLIFFIVTLLVFIFVLILFLGIRNRKSVEVTENAKEDVSDTEDNTVKYEGYAEQINSVFSGVYGYSYTMTVAPSADNTYFLDGIMPEIIGNSSYQIYGTVIERGLEGRISTESGAEEDFAFTSKNSYLTGSLFQYIETLPADDKRKEESGYENFVDLGYTVSGTEFMNDVKEMLLNSKYIDEKSAEGSYTVTYPEGSLKADTGRYFFDKLFNEYPGDLTLTVRVEEGEDYRNVIIDGSGKVSFSMTMRELTTINQIDSSYLNDVYEHSDNMNDPFKEDTTHLTYQEYLDRYSK